MSEGDNAKRADSSRTIVGMPTARPTTDEIVQKLNDHSGSTPVQPVDTRVLAKRPVIPASDKHGTWDKIFMKDDGADLDSLVKGMFADLTGYERLTGFVRDLEPTTGYNYELRYTSCAWESPEARIVVADGEKILLDLLYNTGTKAVQAKISDLQHEMQPLDNILFIIKDAEENSFYDPKLVLRLLSTIPSEVADFLNRKRDALVNTGVVATPVHPALAATVSVPTISDESNIERTRSPTVAYSVQTPPSAQPGFIEALPRSDSPNPFAVVETTDPRFRLAVLRSEYPSPLMVEEALKNLFAWANLKDMKELGHSQTVDDHQVDLEFNLLRRKHNTHTDDQLNYAVVKMLTGLHGQAGIPFSFALESVYLGTPLTEGRIFKTDLPLILDYQVDKPKYYSKGGVFARSEAVIGESLYIRAPVMVDNARQSDSKSRHNKGYLLFSALIGYGDKLGQLLKR